MSDKEGKRHVCPWWMGYILASPLRKLIQNPDKLLSSYITSGMTIMDIGCAMGFFSIPAARMVGETGKVVCIDLQEKMLNTLRKKIKKAGFESRVETVQCLEKSINASQYTNKIDLAMAFAVVHEVPDQGELFREIYSALRSGGKLLLAEPKGHVSSEDFKKTIDLANNTGFKIIEEPKVSRSRTAIFEKV